MALRIGISRCGLIGIVAVVAGLCTAPVSGSGGCLCHQHQPLAFPAVSVDAHARPLAAIRFRLDRNPDDAGTHEQLANLLTQGEPPLEKDSEPYRKTRELLPAEFTELQTRRFIVLSNASPQWTRDQAQRLERAHHQFHRFAARLDLEPLPLEHKLVCVLFERREDYRRFAAEHDGVHDEWVAGYYAPQHDRIVFYNVQSDPQFLNAQDQLVRMDGDFQLLRDQARRAATDDAPQEARRLRRAVGEFAQHLSDERQRIDDFVRQVGIATTIHEAIHQLAFHTRVQSPLVQNPLWLSEGLATAFETDAPKGAFGPEHEYAPRRQAFDAILQDEKQLPLLEIIPLSSLAGADEETIRTFYQQSYALVTWMSRFRREELRTYLELLRREEPGAIAAKRQIELFQSAFGDIELLERAWLRHARANITLR